MSAIRALTAQTRYTMLVSARDPRTIAVGIALPVVLLVLFNSIFGSGRAMTNTGIGKIDINAYYVAGIAAYAIAMQCFSWVIISLAAQREMGHLKRLRGTPIPAWTFIASIVLRSLAFAATMVTVVLLIGLVAFGVHLRAEGLIGIAAYTFLGTLSMAAAGVAAATFMRTADMAAATGPLITLILSFASGIFIPVAQLPDWLNSVGRFFPLYHLAEGLQRSVAAGGGTGFAGNDLLVLGAWSAAGVFVAIRRFRWEPARS